jgi:hypothetical protein
MVVQRLHVAGYRSLLDVTVALGEITVILGANGTGKTNLYRACDWRTRVATAGWPRRDGLDRLLRPRRGEPKVGPGGRSRAQPRSELSDGRRGATLESGGFGVRCRVEGLRLTSSGCSSSLSVGVLRSYDWVSRLVGDAVDACFDGVDRLIDVPVVAVLEELS